MPTDTASLPTKTALTIQEMALQSGLSEHTLRYYERIGLIAPIPRNVQSGHRRYPPETVAVVESLSCLRGVGMSLEDIRRFLRLRARGWSAASEQKALFAAHAAAVACELEMMKTRLEYLEGKVAYWTAIEAGDEAGASVIAEANKHLAKKLTVKKEGNEQ